MPIERPDDELEPLPANIRAAFQEYPRPDASAEFDGRFWQELDARKHRYQGFQGILRRLIEVEIEGIAVWKLGFSTVSGAAFCALGIALLSIGSLSPAPTPALPQVAKSNEIPTTAPRFARELLEESAPRPRHQSKSRTTTKKEVSSWGLSAPKWA